MMDIFLKIWFFVVILPYIMLEHGLTKLNKYLKKREIDHEVDIWQVWLLLLIILLIVLFANGYRW